MVTQMSPRRNFIYPAREPRVVEVIIPSPILVVVARTSPWSTPGLLWMRGEADVVGPGGK
jgi:hypothetical protein